MFENQIVDGSIAIGIICLITVIAMVFSYFKFLKSWNPKYENDDKFATACFVTFATFFIGLIVYGVYNISGLNDESTNKISEADKINSEKFVEKVSEITDLSNVDYADSAKKDNILRNLKNDKFVELKGLKNGQKQDVVVFFKGEEMNITVSSPKSDSQNVEEFKYAP